MHLMGMRIQDRKDPPKNSLVLGAPSKLSYDFVPHYPKWGIRDNVHTWVSRGYVRTGQVMKRAHKLKSATIGMTMHLGEIAVDAPIEATQRQRRLLVAFCKLVGRQIGATDAVDLPSGLTPRVRQTLQHLLNGDSEKEIAIKLGLSRHTVHVYVKQLYRHFDVCSRGELLARFVGDDTTSRQ
jgi:DNA-binding CsgD family transcriptional regulator